MPGLLKLTDGLDLENRHVSQLIDLIAGDGPAPEVHIMDSTGLVELFTITDAAVRLSLEGGAASNPFFYVGMVVEWHDDIGSIPAGWAICDGTAGTPNLIDRFSVGAGGTYALNDIGGAATYDISHNHLQDPHSHVQDAHSHSHAHNIDHHHTHPHDHTIDHNHPSEFSTEAVDGLSNSFETGDALGGVTQDYALRPHIHETFTATFVQDSGAVQNESWTLVNDVPSPGGPTGTDVDANPATATNQNTTATNQLGGSAAQSVLNPYYALYKIKRIAA